MNETGLNFGNFHTISVSRQHLQRRERRRPEEGSEPGLQAGRWIWTIAPAATCWPRGPTDSNGNYTFTGVGAGSLSVAEVVQTNWVQTQPLYPTVYTFTTPERPEPDAP